MTPNCLVCLEPTAPATPTHAACIRALFGTPLLPALDVDLAKFHTLALAMVGRTSLSGVQRKLSLGLTKDRTSLQVAVEKARFILKPRSDTFPALPANEQVTMRIARAAGIEVPPCGLLELKDGTLAFVAARFDRPEGGGKLRCEDFCQLAGKAAKEKYDGSAELCMRLVRRFASEPGIEVAKLFRRLLFAWWTGNGDMHLKNFSLLAGPDGRHRLAPAYDQLCTRLVIPDDPLALPVGGKRDRLTSEHWLALADYAELPRKAAQRVLDEVGGARDAAILLVERSHLETPMKADYRALLAERSAALTA